MLVKPTLVLVGSDDELYYPDQYERLFKKYSKARIIQLEGHNHDGILFSSETYRAVEVWLEEKIAG